MLASLKKLQYDRKQTLLTHKMVKFGFFMGPVTGFANVSFSQWSVRQPLVSVRQRLYVSSPTSKIRYKKIWNVFYILQTVKRR